MLAFRKHRLTDQVALVSLILTCVMQSKHVYTQGNPGTKFRLIFFFSLFHLADNVRISFFQNYYCSLFEFSETILNFLIKLALSKIYQTLQLIIVIEVHKHTRSAILPTHSPFAVTSPMFSPLAKAL